MEKSLRSSRHFLLFVFFNHIFTENFIEGGEGVSKMMSPKLGESLDLMFSVQ